MSVNAQPTLFVVDDDPAVCRALTSAGKLLGATVRQFASAGEFLRAYDASQPGCLVLELKLPDMSGLELQMRLLERGITLPIVVISGHADVRTAVEAMSRGAVTVLEKPFRLEELLVQVRRALAEDATIRKFRAKEAEANARFASLTVKEHEVLDLLAAGKTNKQIAAELHLSVRAVEDRRARLMKKIQARSLADLVRWRAMHG